jgi:hypothetical protein
MRAMPGSLHYRPSMKTGRPVLIVNPDADCDARRAAFGANFGAAAGGFRRQRVPVRVAP